MRTNPGGQLSPENIVGRSNEISYLWDSLEVQSVYVNAERRIGKTSILTVLQHQPRPGWTTVKRDLENLHTAEEFACAVYKDVDGFLTGRKRTARRLRELLHSVSGTEIAGVLKLPTGEPVSWKLVLEKTVQDLSESFEQGDGRLLLLWDEVPFMIANIARRQGEEVAMEVLDTLRYLRQTYACVRMVLTGSIGLHHVLGRLKRSGYANSPVNDMEAFEIRPLLADDGVRLARALLEGEKIASPDPNAAAAAISHGVDHFPFYVHHLVRRLKRSGRAAEPALIEATLVELLRDPTDPWELRHYVERIRIYYGSDEPLVLAMLDAIANEDELSIDLLLALLKGSVGPVDKERLRELVALLQRDHYIERTEHGTLAFAFGLIRRFWRFERDLPAAAAAP